MTTISRKVLGDLLDARLKTLTGVTVYRGEVPGKPPVIQTNGTPDPSGRTAPYVVFFSSPGTPGVDDEIDVADLHEDLLWSVQLICSAGYEADLDYLVDRVWGVLYRWSPEVDGLECGPMKPPPGYDPGPARRNDNVTPPRHWTPMQFQLPITT